MGQDYHRKEEAIYRELAELAKTAEKSSRYLRVAKGHARMSTDGTGPEDALKVRRDSATGGYYEIRDGIAYPPLDPAKRGR
jgi:hypothetical protein